MTKLLIHFSILKFVLNNTIFRGGFKLDSEVSQKLLVICRTLGSFLFSPTFYFPKYSAMY